jgi:hypothetical protein
MSDIFYSDIGLGVVVLNATDCFETVVKSCYLSYFPVVGCAISASSLAGASTVGIKYCIG